jgi:hypothetical protein
LRESKEFSGIVPHKNIDPQFSTQAVLEYNIYQDHFDMKTPVELVHHAPPYQPAGRRGSDHAAGVAVPTC